MWHAGMKTEKGVGASEGGEGGLVMKQCFQFATDPSIWLQIINIPTFEVEINSK